MPVPRETEVPFRENSKQVGVNKTLGSGSIFKGYQKSKGNSYEVEVVLQVMTAGEAWRAEGWGFGARRDPKLRNVWLRLMGLLNFRQDLSSRSRKVGQCECELLQSRDLLIKVWPSVRQPLGIASADEICVES